MKTVCVQIGNTDNKLTQQEWAEFVSKCEWQIAHCYGLQIHFAGAPPSNATFQNFAWVCNAPDTLADLNGLKKRLADVGRMFRQESIAVTTGETEFVACHAR